jgi:hypothetical protein
MIGLVVEALLVEPKISKVDLSKVGESIFFNETAINNSWTSFSQLS